MEIFVGDAGEHWYAVEGDLAEDPSRDKDEVSAMRW